MCYLNASPGNFMGWQLHIPSKHTLADLKFPLQCQCIKTALTTLYSSSSLPCPLLNFRFLLVKFVIFCTSPNTKMCAFSKIFKHSSSTAIWPTVLVGQTRLKSKVNLHILHSANFFLRVKHRVQLGMSWKYWPENV